MAEALAIIGLVTNVIQLAQYSIEICERAKGFAKNASDLPKSFQGLQACLPMIKNSLSEIYSRIESERIDESTCQTILPVVENCESHLKELQTIFKDILPSNGASKWTYFVKAVSSMARERDVKRLADAIDQDVRLLTLYYATDGSVQAANARLMPPISVSMLNMQSVSITHLKDTDKLNAETPFLLRYARNPNFVGREAHMKDIESKLQNNASHNRVVLIGLGGIGKSQVAIEFAYRYRKMYPKTAIYWIHASDASRFEIDYIKIGLEAKLLRMTDPDQDPKKIVRDWLSSKASGKWLMIVDNADDVNDFFPTEQSERARGLAEFLPSYENGSILITTRNRKVGVKFARGNGIIELKGMNPDVAEKLFCAQAGEDNLATNDTAELLKLLDYLPLAIAQAAAYIAENSISTAEYLEMLKQSEESAMELLAEDFAEPGRDYAASNTIATVWLISFDQIRRSEPLAAEILCSMACFDRQAIPRDLLPAGSSPVKLSTSLGLLKGYSLISLGESDQVFEMHRLVHMTTRNWSRKNGTFGIQAETCLQTMLQLFPSGEHETLAKCDLYLPHAQALLACEALSKDTDASKAALAHKVSLCLLGRGRYSSAEIMAQRAVQWRASALGTSDKLTLASMSNLAFVLGKRGNYEKAHKMLLEVLEGQKRLLGLESLETLTTIGYVAEMLRKLGKYDEAQTLHRQALAGREKVQGKEHIDTLSTSDDLAWVLLAQGQYAEAEILQRRALAGRQRALGPDHPETLASVSDLAIVLRKQGKIDEAEKLQRRAVEERTKVLGPKHPHTLWSMSDLAAILRKQHKLDAAEELHREVYHSRKEVLGSEHLYTLWSISDLGSVALDRGDPQTALSLQLQALKGRQNILGDEHPDTLTSFSKTAMVYLSQGDLATAQIYHERAFAGRQKVLGREHPATQASKEHLSMFHDIHS